MIVAHGPLRGKTHISLDWSLRHACACPKAAWALDGCLDDSRRQSLVTATMWNKERSQPNAFLASFHIPTKFLIAVVNVDSGHVIMLCLALFNLPLRRQRDGTGRRDEQTAPSPNLHTGSSSSFTVLGFRPIDPATSRYQTRISEIRMQEQFPFTMAPSFDLHEDGPPLRKKAKTVDSEPNIECRVCFSPIDDASYVTPCRTCRKPICFECIKGQWLAALSDHERMPVRCCGRVVYHDVAKNILPPAELAIYKLRFDESSTPNPFYCPLPTCSTFIPPRLLKPVRGKITCDICATISCVRCKQPASEDHRCPNTNEKATILKSFNYKLCPKCGTGIMRMFGCAHVRCQ